MSAESGHFRCGLLHSGSAGDLAFRTPEVDWQLWVAAGDKPYPCRYVVTSKWLAGSPEHQLKITNRNDSPEIAADAFRFEPAKNAEQVDLDKLPHLEILLPETPQGENQ